MLRREIATALISSSAVAAASCRTLRPEVPLEIAPFAEFGSSNTLPVQLPTAARSTLAMRRRRSYSSSTASTASSAMPPAKWMSCFPAPRATSPTSRHRSVSINCAAWTDSMCGAARWPSAILRNSTASPACPCRREATLDIAGICFRC